MFKCLINDEEWTIEEREGKFILDEYNRHREEKAGYMFGLTSFPDRKIYLNSEVESFHQKRRTLLHELMHAFLWSMGACEFDRFDEEDMCNFSAASHYIIHDIVEKYFKPVTMVANTPNTLTKEEIEEVILSMQEENKERKNMSVEYGEDKIVIKYDEPLISEKKRGVKNVEQ